MNSSTPTRLSWTAARSGLDGTRPTSQSPKPAEEAAGRGPSTSAERNAVSASGGRFNWARTSGIAATVSSPPRSSIVTKVAAVMPPILPSDAARGAIRVTISCATTSGTTTIRRALPQRVPTTSSAAAVSASRESPAQCAQPPSRNPISRPATDPAVSHARLPPPGSTPICHALSAAGSCSTGTASSLPAVKRLTSVAAVMSPVTLSSVLKMSGIVSTASVMR